MQGDGRHAVRPWHALWAECRSRRPREGGESPQGSTAGQNANLGPMGGRSRPTRRTSKEPVEKSGWSIFHTWTSAPDFFSPGVNLPVRANGEKAWFGWPTDPKIEEMIDAWFT